MLVIEIKDIPVVARLGIPAILTIIGTGVAYAYLKTIRRGQRLTQRMKIMLQMFPVVVFGNGVIAMFYDRIGNTFHSDNVMLYLIVLWSVLVIAGRIVLEKARNGRGTPQ